MCTEIRGILSSGSLFFPIGKIGPRHQKDIELQSAETDVKRVVLSGLIMRPIFELDSRHMLNQEGNHHLDIIWLAFALLDVVSEMTEYPSGVSRKDVIARLESLILEQAHIIRINTGPQAVTDVQSA